MFAYAKVRKKTPLNFNFVQYLGNVIQQANVMKAIVLKKSSRRYLGN